MNSAIKAARDWLDACVPGAKRARELLAAASRHAGPGLNAGQVNFSLVFLLFVAAAGFLSACMQQQDDGSASRQTSTLLYKEQEAGTAGYPVRVLINAAHLRLDDGYEGSDFILMERKSRTIYSVSHEEKRILVMTAPAVDQRPPADLDISVEQEEDAGSPLIAGVRPVQVRIKANNEVCFQAILVPGLLPAAVAGLIEYAQALGDRQLDVLDEVPESVRTPCYLARYAYAPAQHLRQGLPVQEWDVYGYRRALVDFKEPETVLPTLFLLPPDYERIRIETAG
ncbi:MAG: hypothetical protein WBO57_01550 [Gammaproteobacteria bacterium]